MQDGTDTTNETGGALSVQETKTAQEQPQTKEPAKEPGQDQGALSEQKEDAAPVDYSKMSDEEYFKDFKPPEGVEVDVGDLTKNYGEFLRRNGISQTALSEFLAIEDKLVKASSEAERAANEKAEKELKAEFQKEGEAVRREFSPEQIESAKTALREFGTDKTFMSLATGRLSNSATLVKLLVNWAETHRGDGVPGGGAAPSQRQDFASLWRG